MSESIKLPFEWNCVELDTVAQVIDPHPSHRAPDEERDGIPFAGIGDLNEKGEIVSDSVRRVSPRVLNEHANRYALSGNSIGFGRVASIGKVIDFPEGISNVAISPTMAVIEPNSVDRKYLLQALQSNFIREQIDRLLTGTTRSSLGIELLRKLSIPIPANGEPEKIGLILTTIDNSIKNTETLIKKYQQIKAGLMHDLFTRGVIPDGHLRPTQAQAPHLYKDSPLGWIPKEWEVKQCSEVCEKITVGIVIRPTQYYVSEGIPTFRSANVRESGLDTSDLVFISNQANTLLDKSQLREGDIISVRTGYPGTSAVVPAEFSGTNCVDLLISRPSSRIRSDFLVNWINSSFGKDQVLRRQGGLAQQHFNVGEMRNLLVGLPKMEEQKAIVSRLNTISARINSEQILVAKLRHQKHGLMHDLLTGRVRVKVGDI